MRFVFSLPHMSGGPDLGLSPITTFKRILVLEDLLRGFYVYDNKRKAGPDPEIAKYIEKARSMSDAKVDPKLMKLSDKDIIEMIFFPVVNESCRLLHEGIVVKASDLDIAAVSGMGFPPCSDKNLTFPPLWDGWGSHHTGSIPSLNSEILELRRLRKWMEKLEESDRKQDQLSEHWGLWSLHHRVR
ncbi:hypothetical protein C5167_009184 [Papaver somniferum]|uniref:Uncharacterized protein n=1 Tax=Papaver somniferum TaxID=3469 RepID=A0A4Y7JWN6_PAPSO|nr:hypothetical protein C5167_009184 [Papaver somniferum]